MTHWWQFNKKAKERRHKENEEFAKKVAEIVTPGILEIVKKAYAFGYEDGKNAK